MSSKAKPLSATLVQLGDLLGNDTTRSRIGDSSGNLRSDIRYRVNLVGLMESTVVILVHSGPGIQEAGGHLEAV
jgi:hypothetical protein